MHKRISSCTSHISWEFSGLTSPAMGDFSDLLCTATQRSLQEKMTCSIPSRQMPKHHTHTHKTKAKITLHQFFLSFLLYLYDSINFLHKLQKDWKEGLEGNSFQSIWSPVVGCLSEKLKNLITLYSKLSRKQTTTWTFSSSPHSPNPSFHYWLQIQAFSSHSLCI